MAKKRAKKVKDLDPKGRAKKVKGGRRSLGSHVEAIGGHTGRATEQIVEGAGDAVNATGQAFNRTLNPR